jgi:hypothetical protein
MTWPDSAGNPISLKFRNNGMVNTFLLDNKELFEYEHPTVIDENGKVVELCLGIRE